MLEALKTIWVERSDNLYENIQSIKLLLLTVQYVMATGDLETWENLYGYDRNAV